MSRVREMDPRRRDLWIALILLVEFQVEVSLSGVSGGDEWAGRAILAVLALALAVRSRVPVVALALGFASLAALSGMSRELNDALLLPFFTLFYLAFSLALLRDGRTLVLGIALACIGAAVAMTVDSYSEGPGEFIFVCAILIAAPVLAGRVLRSRNRLAEVLRDKAERAERERGDAVVRAVADERERIAGELHDVVSHALSGMVVQASAARTLAQRDPDRARQAFAAVEGAGREALDEMRRLLGVLRRADEDLALAPQPSLEHLSTLLHRAQSAGLPVDLDVTGERRTLPIGTDLIAYRVVQEALSGALDAGGAGRARVSVAYGDEHVEIEVHDDGGGRRDLLGVEQRVALYGGRLIAGGTRGGGHTVRARLPVVAAA